MNWKFLLVPAVCFLCFAGCRSTKEDPYFHESFIEDDMYERMAKRMSILESGRYIDQMKKEGWTLLNVEYPVADDDPNLCVVMMERPLPYEYRKTKDTRGNYTKR